MEGVFAVIICFAGDFAPKQWATCDGQFLSISQNTALFSLLGTTYGGNGQNTFRLPDLRGRAPVSQGQGPGLSAYSLGQPAGSESATITTNNLPPHVHTGAATFQLPASSDDGIDSTPNSGYPSRFTGAYSTTANVAMLTPGYNGVIGVAGSSQPFNIRLPYLAINFVICLNGIFPSRN
jgi:microcystin-dependent protein